MSVTVWESVPLVPVTPTWKVPVDENVHESVELPVPVTLVGLRLHDVLFVERVTGETKPFWPVTVMVDVAVVPTLAVTVVGLAVTV